MKHSEVFLSHQFLCILMRHAAPTARSPAECVPFGQRLLRRSSADPSQSGPRPSAGATGRRKFVAAAQMVGPGDFGTLLSVQLHLVGGLIHISC